MWRPEVDFECYPQSVLDGLEVRVLNNRQREETCLDDKDGKYIKYLASLYLPYLKLGNLQ